ncbi:glutathione ABC transporter ATP-binding protein [halophilic archaeon]|nr:glutathione ABC transporter ATP-binding protein [halophilic archaeon]
MSTQTPTGDDTTDVTTSNDQTEPLLDVQDLRTEFVTGQGRIVAANDVSFTLNRGETMGIVGESGAGKSVTARSIMRLIDSPGEISGGRVVFEGEDLLELTEDEMQDVRGKDIALIPQDPMSALNPVLTVGSQITETIEHHQGLDEDAARERAIEAMEEVEIPDAETRIDDYPHEFSGGMRQRVLLAIGLSCQPDLIIADEPTTALDVTTQAKILDLINDLQEEKGMAVLMITHNLGVVAQTCDHVGVMYAGNLVETAQLDDLFAEPQHPYTRALIDSIPEIDADYEELPTLEGSMPDLADLPEGCNFALRCPYATEDCRSGGDPPLEPVPGTDSKAACIHAEELDLSESTVPKSGTGRREVDRSGDPLFEVRNLKKYFSAGDGVLGNLSLSFDGGFPSLDRQYVNAVDGVSFDIYPGETLGLVGESGCGKSTVARTALRLLEPTEGEVYFEGQPLHELGDSDVRSLRREMQMIFQDPQSSLNPRKTVGQIIGRTMEKHNIASGEEKQRRVSELLKRVGLSGDASSMYPHEFSGGQQQRVAIAHALAVEPKLIVCDEPVSALDVSVQAQILNLLNDLQTEREISFLFISHNIGVIRHVCDRVAVMYLGTIAEIGTVEQVFGPPYHPYTESLLSAIPHADPRRKTDRILLEGAVPSPIDPPSGCRFHTRCPKKIGEVCETEVPTLEEKQEGTGHQISCHLSVEDMSERDFRREETVSGD